MRRFFFSLLNFKVDLFVKARECAEGLLCTLQRLPFHSAVRDLYRGARTRFFPSKIKKASIIRKKAENDTGQMLSFGTVNNLTYEMI